MNELSDADVFGAPAQPREMSDADVFSQPAPKQLPPDQRQKPYDARMENAVRSLGQSAEAGLEGMGTLYDLARVPFNSLGANIPSSTDIIRSHSPFPPPKGINAVAADLTRGATSGLESLATGAGLAESASPLASQVGQVLTKSPAGQIGGFSTGEASRGAAQRAGAGPVGQMAASLVGAAPGFMVGNLAERGLNAAAGIEPEAAATPPVSKAQSKAKDILNQALKVEGLDPNDIADRLELAQRNGQPLTALDVATQNVGGVQTKGRNLLGLADAAANMPGEGASMAGDVAERGTMAKQRIGQAFDQFISSGKPYQVSDDALQKISTEAAPAYEQAFSQGPIYSDRIGELLKSPEVQTGIQRGMQIQRIEAAASGKPFSLMDYAGVLPDDQGNMVIKGTPNMRLLDAGKQGLDAMIGDETNDLTGRTTQMGRALTQLKKSYVKELDNLNPDYAAARNAYGSQASRLQAVKDGMNFMQMQPEEIRRYMADPNNSLSDQMAFSVGVRQKLQDIMSQVGDNANAVTRLWKQNIRDRLEPMFGDQDAFAQFSDIMQHEQNMARVNGILTRGSQTMPRQQYADAIQQAPSNISNALRFITNPKGAAIQAGAGLLNDQLQKSASKMTNETAAEVMRHLLTNDPTVWRSFNTASSPGMISSAMQGPAAQNAATSTLARIANQQQKSGGRINRASGGKVPSASEWAGMLHKARKKGINLTAKDRHNQRIVDYVMGVL